MKDLSQIIQRPLVTERGAVLREKHNQYFFAVAPEANKQEIKRAVEHFFGVKVLDVRTQNRGGKKKRLGRYMGYRADWKKAIVTLAADDTIELFDIG